MTLVGSLPACGSRSQGDPACFLGEGRLDQGLGRIDSTPRAAPALRALIRRHPGDGRREGLSRGELSAAGGLLGDRWARGQRRRASMQVAAMDWRIATLLAGGQALELFGDQLFLDLDLSTSALPSGTFLGVGAAVLMVTDEPHVGCGKFARRFGREALAWTARAELTERRLRGVYLQVILGGAIEVGDPVRVLGAQYPQA
jgi:MOSC domain-containing protein YiiM